MEPKDRTLFVQILAQLLIVDGVLRDKERTHLDRVMDELEMPPEERKAALAGVSIDSPIAERAAALSPGVGDRLVAALAQAMYADGKPEPAEEAFVEKVRQLLG